jgi:hypothetical protein
MLLSDGVQGRPIREGVIAFESVSRGRKSMMHHSNARTSPGAGRSAGDRAGRRSHGAKLAAGEVMAAVVRATARLNARTARLTSPPGGLEEGWQQELASMRAVAPFVGSTRRNTVMGGGSSYIRSKSPSARSSKTGQGSPPKKSSAAEDYWGSTKYRSTGPGFVLEQLGPKLWLRVHRSGRCDALTSPTARTCIPLDYVSNAEYTWKTSQNGGLRR